MIKITTTKVNKIFRIVFSWMYLLSLFLYLCMSLILFFFLFSPVNKTKEKTRTRSKMRINIYWISRGQFAKCLEFVYITHMFRWDIFTSKFEMTLWPNVYKSHWETLYHFTFLWLRLYFYKQTHIITYTNNQHF